MITCLFRTNKYFCDWKFHDLKIIGIFGNY